MDKQIANKAIAIKAMQEKFKPQRESLVEFMKFMWEQEKKTPFDIPKHYYEIQDKLTKMLNGEINRLIINVPPRTGKTLMITELFPIWAMGNNKAKNFIATGYSTSLTREFSGHSRDWYSSQAFKRIFPTAKPMRDDQNTKEYWKTDDDSSYYATGAEGTITGRGCDIFIIDDPIKPDEADSSEVAREGVNNWYLNTVRSRLNDARKGGIIVIMQRTHENDLAGFLMDLESKGLGEKWDKVIVPAIDIDGHSISEGRFPISVLQEMKSTNPVVFSCQYQQEPLNKETQEFHEEWLRFFDIAPKDGRIFAMLDPANSKDKESDESVIIVGRVIDADIYIEEICGGRFSPSELEDKCLYIGRKWSPERFGVEVYAAQAWVEHAIKNRFIENNVATMVESVAQKGSKEDKIRGVIAPLRNGHIYFKRGMAGLDNLIDQMRKFPRGRHDDYIDCLQMLWFLCNMQPAINLNQYSLPQVEYFEGRPVFK